MITGNNYAFIPEGNVIVCLLVFFKPKYWCKVKLKTLSGLHPPDPGMDVIKYLYYIMGSTISNTLIGSEGFNNEVDFGPIRI